MCCVQATTTRGAAFQEAWPRTPGFGTSKRRSHEIPLSRCLSHPVCGNWGIRAAAGWAPAAPSWQSGLAKLCPLPTVPLGPEGQPPLQPTCPVHAPLCLVSSVPWSLLVASLDSVRSSCLQGHPGGQHKFWGGWQACVDAAHPLSVPLSHGTGKMAAFSPCAPCPVLNPKTSRLWIQVSACLGPEPEPLPAWIFG